MKLTDLPDLTGALIDFEGFRPNCSDSVPTEDSISGPVLRGDFLPEQVRLWAEP